MKLWTRKCHPDYVVDVKHTRLTRWDVKVPRKNSNKNSSSAIRLKNQIWMQRWEGLKRKAGNKNIDICISNQMLQGFHFDKLLETIAAMAISKTSFLFLFFEKRKKNCQLMGPRAISFHFMHAGMRVCVVKIFVVVAVAHLRIIRVRNLHWSNNDKHFE